MLWILIGILIGLAGGVVWLVWYFRDGIFKP